MLPTDFTVEHGIAIAFLFGTWLAYPLILRLFGIAPLNTQLMVARRKWVNEISNRSGNPFDAILLGHITNSVAFFGSATLIVLAGIFTIVVHIESIHNTVTNLHFIDPVSLELFALMYGLLASVLIVCFFSFTYALRQLLYSIALIGALPESASASEAYEDLTSDTTTVLTQALKTFNFGIRGYYYAMASMCLFVSPMLCIIATSIVTAILIYRQVKSPTSRAIARYTRKVKTNHEH